MLAILVREVSHEWEAIQSSTYRELLGVIPCLQSFIEICKSYGYVPIPYVPNTVHSSIH